MNRVEKSGCGETEYACTGTVSGLIKNSIIVSEIGFCRLLFSALVGPAKTEEYADTDS